MSTKTPRPPPRVLFVHDGQPFHAQLKHLTDAGLSVRDADARDAVSSALSFDPDVIVLDFGCNGEVAAALQAEPNTRDIPVIALAKLTVPSD